MGERERKALKKCMGMINSKGVEEKKRGMGWESMRGFNFNIFFLSNQCQYDKMLKSE